MSHPFVTPVWDDEDDVRLKFEETALHARWRHRVVTPPANDMLICVTPSSKTGVSGTGKTTLATTMGKQFDKSESGFEAETQATLDAGELAYDILPHVEQKSAVIFDEAQGAPGTDSVNARRGMKQEAIDAISAILANRDRSITLIIIAQQLSMLDSLLYPLIDAWLLIRKEPSDPRGPEAVHHKLTIDDYDLGSPNPRTPAIEDLSWDPLPDDDPDYRAMERKKQAAKTRGGDNEVDNRELEKETQLEIAQGYRDQGMTLREICDQDLITFSRETVRKNTVDRDDD